MTIDVSAEESSPETVTDAASGTNGASAAAADPAVEALAGEQSGAFAVHLENFEGPFDLLLSLISKHKLDITEVSLSRVTDEFIAHIKMGSSGADGGKPWDLEETSQFLLVAATLLDLKTARLLPQGDVEDEEDLALLEARDLLFARLMQYRAFKQVASVLEERMLRESVRHPRAVGLEERFATLLPEVLIGLGLDEFAALAARALEPKPVMELSLAHIHAPAVSVKEQGLVVVERLRRQGTMTFRALAGDAPDVLTRVARFLSLLELFREGAVAFDQVTPLGELTVRWTGSEDGEVEISDEFDGTPPDESESEAEPDPVVEPVETNRVVEFVETNPDPVVELVETNPDPVVELVETPASENDQEQQ